MLERLQKGGLSLDQMRLVAREDWLWDGTQKLSSSKTLGVSPGVKE
jgi:hypothetical protein